MSRIYPGLTQELSRAIFQLPASSAYIYGASSTEDRGILGEDWIQTQTKRGAVLLPLVAETRETITLTNVTGKSETFSLFDQAAIQAALQLLPQPLYIDITAIAFGSWAAILRAALISRIDLKVLYVEPSDYIKSTSPFGNLKYDLSDRTEGIAPLPGFARLTSRRAGSQQVLVPLLGFEGDRLARILTEIEPDVESTYPVVGLPGFRPEYTFHSLESNIRYLDEWGSTSNLRYSRANCPFGIYSLLTQLSEFFPKQLIQVAVLGTKPHALGAALFAIARPTRATLLYDHPVRSKGRTSGAGRLCLYDIDKFSKFYPLLPDVATV
ncbi:hypothetical protein [Paenarthrobacter aromaticivorans]|uniref:Uncharacterized protein n=1 Tax=Paenarthrobacter aromaticivorans TaxID=2849150 RepID=A0ABS6I9P4_9MICC|nr:hypothetical protein [Paenarthrobacter sp. MMS21-TAE1-1]MBU8868441.1 hypothetical protein [Paenarthrobacter sp. MMS21-TAE1-1]